MNDWGTMHAERATREGARHRGMHARCRLLLLLLHGKRERPAKNTRAQRHHTCPHQASAAAARAAESCAPYALKERAGAACSARLATAAAVPDESTVRSALFGSAHSLYLLSSSSFFSVAKSKGANWWPSPCNETCTHAA